ncbi:MAG TPA: tetratricopeptide repeat protein, partial [Tepidisphaeraceae bacterium]
MTVCRSRAVLLAAVLSVAATARAQIAIDAPAAKDMQSVYVRDSGVAAERLSLAERMERLKEWDKAADVYQEIIEKYPDRMIASQSDEANRTIRYTSVVDVAQQRLARWPEEGLRVYRDRFGPRAQDLLDQGNAEDRATRQRVFGQFFNTDAGLAAGLQLLTSGLERGEFSAAAWAGRRLLELHPGLAIERPLVLFQTGIAEHLAGNSAAAAQRLDALKQQFPAAIAKVRGEDAVLADFLATELSRQPTMVRTFRSDSWPMPFGSPDASAVPEQVSAGGARLFSVELPSHARRGMIRRDQQLLERARSSGIMTGILPAIDNGELFFQDNARIYGISLSSGLPLTGWPQVRLGTGEALIPEAVPTPRGKQLGVTVTPTQVVALLGHNDTTMQMLQGNLAQPTLVSVDRATGRRQWSATTLRLTLPEAQANLKDSRFYGLPMVIGDSVYVLARAMRSGQFEECHLISLRASDGVFQWATYIASTATGRPDEDFDGTNTQGAAAAQMSYADGRLYVLTNLGAIACVDSGDGGMVYLSVYPRGNDNIVPPANPRRIRPFPMPSGPVKPFTLNPPIIADGRLFVMPTDSPYLF